jgi:predicted dehydrogenase
MNGASVAVVGTGFGARVHVPALRAAGFEVRVLVGQDPERTARRAQRLDVPHAVTSLAAALDTGVVAVTIAAPPATHLPLVLEAIAAGRHVLCEKPLAVNAHEARRMRDAARDAGVAALVGHEFRFTPTHVAISDALAQGVIGAELMAGIISHTSLLADETLRMPRWWGDAAQGGGWLAASGSHTIDNVRRWLGEIESVSAALQPLPGTSVDGGFTARMRLVSGADAVIQESAMSLGPPFAVTRIVGTRGSITLHRGTVTVAAPDERQLVTPSEGGAAVRSSNPADRFTHLEIGPYTRLAQAFHAAVTGGAATDTLQPATFDDGVACMAVLDTIRESAAADGALTQVR